MDSEVSEDWVVRDFNIDNGNCYKYAQFMHRLSHSEADCVFWFLFLFQIICLVAIVQLYDSVQERYRNILNAEEDALDAKELEEVKKKVRKISKRCLAQTLFLFILLLFSTAMQVFAAHTILFCHQESLMHLYFPVWTVFAIGITFATLGCCVTQMYALKTMKLPPFGVALGTPVLVVSAVTHLLWNSCTGHKKLNRDVEDGLQPVMTHTKRLAPHTSVPSQPQLGNSTLSLANGPVIQIWTGEGTLPLGAHAIGTTSQGYVIIEHVYSSSSESSESSRSPSRGRPTASRGRDGKPSQPSATGHNGGITTRTVTFEEPDPCCPGL
ncbi:hypothetical protein BKA65DRAFT_56390 [Rhexocercosporidium sp. MPI-PUGE-AT-0058]|nr:hypothetical protein BKA65DRAFT_56390 [Rhexocercosporidium sp. MPI-PUGE-AT-0058]